MNTDKLRELAEKAKHPYGWFYLDELEARFEADVHTINQPAIELIEALSPETVLALLDEIDALRKGQGKCAGKQS